MSYEKDAQNKNNRKKKNTSLKQKKFFQALTFTTAVILVLGIIIAGFTLNFVYSTISDSPDIDPRNMYDLLGNNSFILDNEGNILEEIEQDEHRVIVDYAEIPEIVRDGFVAIEDERFWSHNGLDFKRIVGAAWSNISSGTQQGGSTITQQLAKNLYLTHDQTYTRKIQDAYYATQIENQLSKDQILEAYLNTINLGGQNHGVEAASQAYFSKPVSELDLVEGALLAGIPRNPSRYSPIRYVHEDDVSEQDIVLDDTSDYVIIFDERSIPRYQLVLRMMHKNDYITEEEYESALAEGENLHERINPSRYADSGISSHFADLVKDDVIEALVEKGHTEDEANQLLYSGGLRIHSTLERGMQEITEEEFNNPDNFPDSLRDEQGNLLRDEDGNVQPQGAMVISDPKTGEIKAFMGGRETTGRRIFNRAIGSGRPPGSSMKPLAAYLPALNNQHTVASVIDDIPVYLNPEKPEERYPRNVNREYAGLTNLREGVKWSSNVVAMRLMLELGSSDSDSLRIMGEALDSVGVTINNPVNSTVLGSDNVSPYEMNRAYNVIANEGVYTDLISFTRIEDASGNLILENQPEKHRVYDPEVSYLMTDIMRTAVNSGYGRQAAIRSDNQGIPVSGKTGTTQDQKDAWFVGFTPYLSGATWMGFDDNDNPITGSSVVSARLWSQVMTRIHEDYENKDFTRPDNIISREVCAISGKIPTELCERDPRGSQVTTELFIRGTEPTEECDSHVLVKIHEPTGTLATDDTPEEEIKEKVYVSRPVPYYPEDHDGITPRDWPYELPKEYEELEEYDPEIHGTGSVTVKYVEIDENGEVIQTLSPQEYVIEDEKAGTEYSTEQLTFDNYEFVGMDPDSAPASGTVSKEDQHVIYQYQAVLPEDSEDDEPDEDENGETDNEENEDDDEDDNDEDEEDGEEEDDSSNENNNGNGNNNGNSN
ncbi:transglycosylase domain-containing protein [Isachenkonia alkalipeptolytica]|uniref:Penicillin-binding protein 1A n=1 Tax=Isachenkonia alkalipeptolytica TaxID=2565777 RepID=A0AA43XLQ3_9CLOT|nr:transglycosylase domain-containing protein [Isachenkonia alkalipeptolytica]NBG88972.1 penicillin-binding protein [Isachenkonia alkalipeptolytica]